MFGALPRRRTHLAECVPSRVTEILGICVLTIVEVGGGRDKTQLRWGLYAWSRNQRHEPHCVFKGILPYADGLLDLIIYVSRSDGTFDLHWSQTLRASEVNPLAQRTQRRYEMRDWTRCRDAQP